VTSGEEGVGIYKKTETLKNNVRTFSEAIVVWGCIKRGRKEEEKEGKKEEKRRCERQEKQGRHQKSRKLRKIP